MSNSLCDNFVRCYAREDLPCYRSFFLPPKHMKSHSTLYNQQKFFHQKITNIFSNPLSPLDIVTCGAEYNYFTVKKKTFSISRTSVTRLKD